MAYSTTPSGLQCKPLHIFMNLSFSVLLMFFLTIHLIPSLPLLQQSQDSMKLPSHEPPDDSKGCNGLQRYESYESKCRYLTSKEAGCDPEGYINYLYIFYCICGRYPVFGYAMLILWLVLLFYLLGNTTARYFCSNLEGLSRLLHLPPTLAGATLLSLGNGAPDVFSTIVSFLGDGRSDVGINGVLGGGFFVSSVVAGTVGICIVRREIVIDKSSFIRDVCFLALVLSVLLVMLIIGEINVWGAMAFTSLYAVYVLLVSLGHFHWKYGDHGDNDLIESGSTLPVVHMKEHEDLGAPLLVSIEVDEPVRLSSAASFCCWITRVVKFVDLPLYLPRRLTIPDVCKERWSKPYAVVSVVLAPILLATLWDSKRADMGSDERLVIYLFGGLSGLVLGIAALVKTKKERPPTRLLLPWLVGGFLMSVVWTYILAEELVSLLVSLGAVLGISSSVLGLTVLAWGNSLGDLVANVGVAISGGEGGAQVAMSGCYGGPIFNIVVGLGVSLVISSWGGYPSPCPMPKDPTLFQTLGFMIGGLLWTLAILPRRGMKPDRVLGCGLLCIYLCFLSIRFGQAFGLLQMQ